jgi:hypothetical protein
MLLCFTGTSSRSPKKDMKEVIEAPENERNDFARVKHKLS